MDNRDIQTDRWASRRERRVLHAIPIVLALVMACHVGEPGAQPLPDSVRSCAPCHRTTGNNQVGEWLVSPYSAQPGGLECRGCHTVPCTGQDGGKGGSTGTRVTSVDRLRAAVRLTVAAEQSHEDISVEVMVANVGAGHLLPTGPADRILVLEVAAFDESGSSLSPRKASILPASSRFSGTAERALVEKPDAREPATSRPRLAPFATDVSRYRFAPPKHGLATVNVRLLLIRPGEASLEIVDTTTLCDRVNE